MTEQEAIKILEYQINMKNEDVYTPINYEAIETVLSMLKEKDRQINSKNGTINALQCALKERTEEKDRKDNIITKQKKIIDLMAEKIHQLGSDYDDFCIDIVWNEDCDEDCKECIKQYFERKANNETNTKI